MPVPVFFILYYDAECLRYSLHLHTWQMTITDLTEDIWPTEAQGRRVRSINLLNREDQVIRVPAVPVLLQMLVLGWPQRSVWGAARREKKENLLSVIYWFMHQHIIRLVILYSCLRRYASWLATNETVLNIMAFSTLFSVGCTAAVYHHYFFSFLIQELLSVWRCQMCNVLPCR